MKAIFAALFCLVASFSVAAENPPAEPPTPQAFSVEECRLKISDAEEKTAKSGCCSHHGGVCGCSGVRAQCCDGALSPTCGCVKEDTERGT